MTHQNNFVHVIILIIYEMFDSNTVIYLFSVGRGKIKVFSLKVALSHMCAGKLVDKLRCKLYWYIIYYINYISVTMDTFVMRLLNGCIYLGSIFFIPSPTKLRRDIVTLPSVLPSFRLSVLPSHPCEHSRINILQWILTKLGTYLVLKRIWNPIDFQGHRSKVKVTG